MRQHFRLVPGRFGLFLVGVPRAFPVFGGVHSCGIRAFSLVPSSPSEAGLCLVAHSPAALPRPRPEQAPCLIIACFFLFFVLTAVDILCWFHSLADPFEMVLAIDKHAHSGGNWL